MTDIQTLGRTSQLVCTGKLGRFTVARWKSLFNSQDKTSTDINLSKTAGARRETIVVYSFGAPGLTLVFSGVSFIQLCGVVLPIVLLVYYLV